MKKFLLVLALFLSFACITPIQTHAHEDVAVEKFGEEETVTPYAAICAICGSTTSTKTETTYVYKRWVDCSHGNTTRDYVYDKTVATYSVCSSCGSKKTVSSSTTTYVSCGKKMYSHAD